MQPPYLRYDDVRLLRPVLPVRHDAMETRQVIQALMRYASDCQVPLLSAPTLGFPMQIIILRSGAQYVELLNPVVLSAQDFVLQRTETCVLTPGLMRTRSRPSRLKVQASRLDGTVSEVILEKEIAFKFSQHMEYIHGLRAVINMTPFERVVVEAAALNGYQARICVELHAILHGKAGENILRRNQSGGPLSHIEDMAGTKNSAENFFLLSDANPLVPSDDYENLVLALMPGVSPSGTVLIESKKVNFLAHIAKFLRPDIKPLVMLPAQEKMEVFASITPSVMKDVVPVKGALIENIKAHAERSVSLVVSASNETDDIGRTSSEVRQRLRSISRRLTANGVFVQRVGDSASAKCLVVEAAMQVFPAVYTSKTHEGWIVLGCRSKLDIEQIMTTAWKVQMQSIILFDFHHALLALKDVRKDGLTRKDNFSELEIPVGAEN